MRVMLFTTFQKWLTVVEVVLCEMCVVEVLVSFLDEV